MVGSLATEIKERPKKSGQSCAGRPPGSNILSALPGRGSVGPIGSRSLGPDFLETPLDGTSLTALSTDPPERRLPLGLDSPRTLVALATLVGLFLRVVVAWRSEVWLDEAYSALLALSDLPGLFAHLSLDSSPPLYYLVLKAWTFLAPVTPFSLRIPSIFFGCATIPAIWYVASRVHRPATGVVAAWLLAVHPLHILYSEEIRMYSLLALLALAFYFALFDVLRRDGSVLPTILAGAGLAYTHYYGLILVGAGLSVALAAMPSRRLRTFVAGLGIGVAYLPWLPLFLTQLRNSEMVGWMVPFWTRYPGGVAILRSFQAFLPGGMKYEFVPLEGLPFQPAIILLGLLPFIALAAKPNRKELFKPLWLPLGVAFVTLLVVVVRSYLSSPVYLAGRSDLVVFPIFLIALAMAVARMDTRARVVFLAAWIALSGLELVGSAEKLKKPGNAEIADALDAAQCNTIVATGLSYAPVAFYELAEKDGARVVPFPIDLASHPGNLDPDQYSLETLTADARILAAEYPPGPGVCVLGGGASFVGPLADAYLAAGIPARQMGVYRTSVLAGAPYVLVTF